MPPADMPMNARIPALALNNPGKGQIKKATDADVKLMALAVAETPTLNDAQFKQQWIENFDTRPTVTTRQWGDVKFVDGKAVLTSTDVTPENTTVKGANDWQAAGLMVPPTGAATGNGYGLYTIVARTDTEEAPGPFACLWPATDRWPGPEVDIFEKASRNDYDGYSTIHFKSASGGDGYTVYRYPAGKIKMSEFHEYSLEWAADHISLYIDKQLIYTTTVNVPKSHADGGENSAFGVGMKPDWAWAQQNGPTNILYVESMSYSAPVVVEPPPPPPAISISDAMTAEGGQLQFTVTLDRASANPVTVAYATANGTADGADYTAVATPLTFAPGEQSKTIVVDTTEDGVVEPNETLTVTLSAPTGATLADAEATGTITNDDVAPVVPGVRVADASGEEGTALGFTVTLDAPTTSTVTVAYTTATGGTAAASDFTATSGTLSFAPNETSQTIAVPTVGDSAVEPNETFFFNLSNPTDATLADGLATGTITNDDSAPIVVPGMRVSDVSVTEGGVLSFAVTLSAASTAPITVNYSTVNGTATAPADYTAASGTLTFAPQQTRLVVAVQTTDETAYENNETMFLRLTGPSGATLADAEGRGLINNNDVAGRTVTGTSGNNSLTGGGGDDVITGGRGNDTMTGGTGADDFRFARLDGFDRIRDFTPDVDDLVFSGIASSTVQVRTGNYSGFTGADVFYGTGGDHVFLQGVTPARFSIANDAVFV